MSNEDKLRDYLKRVTIELHRTEERLREIEESESEPIAIVAMSCRYPGDVDTPEQLWQLLLDGKDAISVFPDNRGWNVEALYDPDPDAVGKSLTREGGLLETIADFDATLFGISPREAIAIDPQQRMLLELSWETIERAGIDPTSLQGSPTGVFVGLVYQDYGTRLTQTDGAFDGHIVIGSAASIASGRISYTFGLEGPAITIDTACSSSLVALHLASQALKRRECSLALAGGVTIMSSPFSFIEFSRQRALAPDGRCKAFSARADGTSWSEGAGLLLLERLSEAQRNGHPVLAAVRGSAVNQDGRSQGLTAPNGSAQERVIRDALASARLGPLDIDAVEAHGTGTALGDPIEATALFATYGEARPPDRPLWLGSLKSNIGHTQAAAGVAGIIKMVLALQHGLLPRTLHAAPPTPHVDWSPGTVRLLAEPHPWTRHGQPRRGAVSSFGISGTNAHVILEEAPPAEERIAAGEQALSAGSTETPLPLLVSAKTEPALRAAAEKLRAHLGATPDLTLDDVAFSLATTRAHLDERAVVVAESTSRARDLLAALATSQAPPGVIRGRARGSGKLAFLFTGQGSQRPAMGRGLYETFPRFRQALDEVAARLESNLGLPLRDVVLAAEGSPLASQLDQTAFTQTALFALEVALFRLVESWGLKPDILMGHSIGEIVAAHLAGVLSLDDACTLVAARASRMQALPGGGAMLVLDAAESDVRPLLGGREHLLDIAAANGPRSTVVAGDAAAIGEVERAFVALGRKATRLRTSHAFHSPRMDPMLDGFRRAIASLAFHPPRIPIISNVTGAVGSAGDMASPEYWVRHARSTVRFADGVRALVDGGVTVALELGPDGVLSAMAQDGLQEHERMVAVPALRKGQDDASALLSALGTLHAHGRTLDWHAFFAARAPRRVPLPTYPFQRERYWLDAPASSPQALLYALEWSALPNAPGRRAPRLALIGHDPLGIASAPAPAARIEVFPDLEAFTATLGRRGRDEQVDALVACFASDPDAAQDVAHEAHLAAHRALALLQAWMGEERLASVPLLLVTRGAVAVGDDAHERERPLDLIHAPLWGLVRSAQHELLGRPLLLLDVVSCVDALAAFPRALAHAATEPQLAFRRGDLFAPRLASVQAPKQRYLPRLDHGTVLITGGTGALGAQLAFHLVKKHGARRLLLLSRQGSEAPAADDLLDRLRKLDAHVTLLACDVADRRALDACLQRIPSEHPLTAVIHTAGVLDDGVLQTLAPQRIDRVFAPKVDAAWNLHRLTQNTPLAAFVLFSSVAGVVGSPAQANYAAANAFLDALAHHRRDLGLPACSLSWGTWAQRGALTGHLRDVDLARLADSGVRPLADDQALALFDQALALQRPHLVPADLDLARLRARAHLVAPVFRGLLPDAKPGAAGASAASSLRERLLPRTAAEREALLLGLVCTEIASVLRADVTDIDPEQPLRERGLDSLMAVELRHRLVAATGLLLPSTLLFDYPSPAALAGLLRRELLDTGDATPAGHNEARHDTDDPIAIVSMACRFPAGVSSPEHLWKLLVDEIDAIAPFPRDRGWNVDDLYDPDPDASGKTVVREGGFLRDAALFDPAFFGISPREALAIDPQQRLLLETSWEAFERAGIDPASLHGSSTGVFVGVIYNDYGARLIDTTHALDGHLAIGSAGSVASGRISYTFGLQGPAITVDTACSSSLVAVHLACQALGNSECSLALAGGASVMSTPFAFVEFSRQRALAADGRCKAFADDADGTAWSEGVGILLLERLSAARRLGHPVLAIVRGSALNQDGRSQGLTAPNGPAQERVIRDALASARLAPTELQALEAHGTGTALGDPIEANALLATYGRGRDPEHPLWLGSLKSNIGHTQAAAGVAGVIKMVLALQHGVLPRTLHARSPSAHVDWSSGTVRLLDAPRPWPKGGQPRRAAVSAFGLSGTNAHLILEEATSFEDTPAAQREPAHWPLPILLSAKTEGALRARARDLRAHLLAHPELALRDIAFSLAAGNARFTFRAVVVSDPGEAPLDALESIARGAAGGDVVSGEATARGKLAFVYPGQGSQWEEMAAALLETSDVFRATIERCAQALAPHTTWSLLDVLRCEPHAPSLDRVDVVQPVLFAVMVALTALWRSLGVEPDAVVGHSQGEIVAAHVAGALSLDDAAKVVAVRSRLLATLAGQGGMAAVELSAAELTPRLSRWGDALALAAINGPRSSVVSGEPHALDAFVRELEAASIFVRRVRVDYASHGAQMERVRAELHAELASIVPSPARVPFYSTLRAEVLSGTELDGTYWFDNLRNQVRFAEATQRLIDDGHRFFVEVSPHPVLQLALLQSIEANGTTAAVTGSLRRGDGSLTCMLASVAELYVRGLSVDWTPWIPTGKRVPLPTYPFQRERYWLDAPRSKASAVTSAGLLDAGHPLLGAAIPLAHEDGVLFTARIALEEHAWLAGHRVFGHVVLPGTAVLELALAAARRVGNAGVEELTLEAPFVLSERGAVLVQLSVGPVDSTGRRPLALHARPEGVSEASPWTQYASGTLGPAAPQDPPELRDWPPRGATPVDIDGLYERLADAGVSYGPDFQGLRAVWKHGDDLFADVELPASVAPDAARYGLHPALLDAALQPLALLGLTGSSDPGCRDEIVLPFAWASVSLFAQAASTARVHLAVHDGQASVVLADTAGTPFATIEALRTRSTSGSQLRHGLAATTDALLMVEWSALLAAPAPPLAGPVAWLGVPCQPALLATLRNAGCDVLLFDAAEPLRAHLDDGATPPALAILACAGAAPDTGSRAPLDAASRALRELQSLLADDARLAAPRLVVLTRRAVATTPEEDVLDLARAPLWGLVRAAQNEFHGRPIALLDIDDHAESLAAIPRALALTAHEPQLALRQGEVRVPRLARVRAGGEVAEARFAAEGTVLVTGATGGLGSLVARHLVEAHAVKHLLLLSRSGPQASGADALCADLRSRGASVTLLACDVSDRTALEACLATIPAHRPLTAILHTAGVLEDALLLDQTHDRLERVFLPKVDAALHLDDLTRDTPLRTFVVFSSAAGVLGAPGQSNYAAANTFLDALASARRARGQHALSLAFGPWWAEAGMAVRLSEGDRARMRRNGLQALSPEAGLSLFDAALRRPDALLVPARVDMSALSAQGADVAPLLRELTRSAGPRTTGGHSASTSLKASLARLPATEHARVLLDFVRAHIAAVLGISTPASIEPERPLKDLGLDSLTAVQITGRLRAATGLTLPSTLLFDRPTPRALVHLLQNELVRQGPVDTPAPRVAPSGDAARDPIAIVAMGCRFPGNIDTPEALWALLVEGGEVVSGFPDNRGWDIDGLFDPDPNAHGKTYTRRGGFVRDADLFDASFFGISPREAIAMDPQQRLLLETAWETIERAHIDPTSLHGSATGVFIGSIYHDYGARLVDATDSFDGYLALGSAGSVASGRISYTLGLEGPAISVDTACSSALVAIHLACQALRTEECSLALAGGVTLMATPLAFVEFSRQRALAPDGRCKPFSAAADGTGWSEGVGLLLLERLCDARRNGHPVLAVVRGSALNQDGKSQGLTAPNGPAQERVIRDALANARLSAGDVDAVEAHGTGTTLGDPIEANAILATYGAAHSQGDPLWLGSIKSNLGHTQATAGVAGIMKMVLALQHELLPRTLHADPPSPHVDWASCNVRLLHAHVPWTSDGRPRRAGVSAFGVSGTNAHVLLEEAPDPIDPPPASLSQPAATETHDGVLLLPLSGKSDAARRDQAARLGVLLDTHPDLALGDIAFSLATTRTAFDHRAVLLASDRKDAREALDQVADGRPDPRVVLGHAKCNGKVALVFPGQGAQWPGMVRALLDASEIFRSAIDECARALAPHIDWDLHDVLRDAKGAPSLATDDVVQPVLFAVMIALAALWRSLGVEPDAVVGHSQGEIAAACVAGALSLDDAATIVARRSRALATIAGRGAMAAVELDPHLLHERLAPFHGRIVVGAVNGPLSTVVSGDTDAVDALLQQLAADHIFARKLRVDYASHSPHVDALGDALKAGLQGVSPRQATIPIYSTVRADRLDGRELDAAYWFENLRSPVRFHEAVDRLLDDGHRFFIEVSPHALLTLALRETARHAHVDIAVTGSLHRDDGTLRRLLHSWAELYVRGLEPRWDKLLSQGNRVQLPTYPFQRERFWLDAARPKRRDRESAFDAAHPLLDAAIPLPDGGMLFTARIALEEQPWLAGHKVLGQPLFPGTAFLELAQAAAHRSGLHTVEELSLLAPLALPPEGAVLVQLSVGAPDATGRRPLAMHARAQNVPEGTPWTQCASGTLAPARGHAGFDLRAWPPAGATLHPLDGLYERLAAIGLDYGPDFQNVRAVWQRGNDLFAEVALAASVTPEAGRYTLHPALLDAAIHPLALALRERGGPLALPFTWAGVSFHRDHGPGVASARVHLTVSDDEISCAVRVADSTGEPIATIDALRCRPVGEGQLRLGLAPVADALHVLDWSAPAATSALPLRGPIVWLGASSGAIASALATLCDAHTVFRLDDLDALRAYLDRGGPSPALVLVPCAVTDPSPEGLPRAALDATSGVLAVLQSWLKADARIASSALVVLTRRAVATRAEEDVLDLAHAPLWGLLRSAQHEFQERAISIVDIDDDIASHAALPRALARAALEPQMALRRGELRVPRLVRAPAHAQTTETPFFDENGTVLITGGTGGLGSAVARHLVERHGVRHLVLLSRRGPAAPGAESLHAELCAAGASVTMNACDVGDRDALAACIKAIPSDHPLTAVIHTAGAIDDALLLDQSRERLERVFLPKADAAFYLHELTRDRPVRTFAMFSSAACMLGGLAQANYAAANAVLDALAQHRRAGGLPALSLSWGPWAQLGMAARLDPAARARFERIGCPPLHPTEALALFDAALGSSLSTVGPFRLDVARLQEHAAQAPPLYQRLLRTPALPTVDPWQGLRTRLRHLPSAERYLALVDTVRELAAWRLGFASPLEIDADARFMELGLNSLTALELRQELGNRLGLSLPATLFFDSPTPRDAASVLLALLEPELPPHDADLAQYEPRDPKRPTSILAPRGHGSGEALAAILRQAHEIGVLDDALRVIEGAAEIRARASAMAQSRPDARSTHPPVRLARGRATPKLFCFPALVVPTGAVQYARFASALQGLRDTWVLPNPGFSAGELLPQTVDEIVGYHAETILRCEGSAPVALLGMSSGGWIAHAVAEHLERLGHAPAAVVLLDTYLKGAIHPRFASALQEAWMDRYPEIPRLDDELTAMTWYQRLFGAWRPAAVSAPTLLVRASEILSEADDDDFDWRTRWELPHVSLDVPGDHLNMLDRHSETTASAVHAWLTERSVQIAAE